MGNKVEFEGEITEFDYANLGINLRGIYLALDKNPSGSFVQISVGERFKVTMERIEPKLKPCPFCQYSEPKYERVASDHHIICPCCGAMGAEASTKSDAIHAWNRREK
jgi:Lar family restriction alleviation protein